MWLSDTPAGVQEPAKTGGNIFDKIGSWFSDRKDDASSAADKAKKEVKK